MPYIGNTVQNQGFAPAVDYFNGNGVTVTFTLSRPVASVAQLTAVIDNVIQNPSTAYTVSGNQITFTSAPLSGTNNIWVEYTSLVTTYAAISQSPSVIGDITASGGFLANGNFGNTFLDGTVVDYVTGNARITTGPADGLTIYNGGTSARVPLAAWDQNGNQLINTTTLPAALSVNMRSIYVKGANNGVVAVSSNDGLSSVTMYSGANSADNPSIIWQNSLRFGTASDIGTTTYTERMRIDTNGYITAASQPSFFAYLPNTATVNTMAGWGALTSSVMSVSWSTQHNIGSCFNSTTGRFTAPVAGRYEFNLVLRVGDNQGQDKSAAIQLWVNGSDYLYSDLWAAYAASYGGSVRPSVSLSVVTQLAAGDYVNMAQFNASGSTIGNFTTWFSGRLLG